MKLHNPLHCKDDHGKPLKKSKVGMEAEFHLLDHKGKISFKDKDLIKQVKKHCPEVNIMKECGKNMIEIGCYPSHIMATPAMDLIVSIEKTLDVAKAKSLDIRFFPFGTYFGKFTPKPNKGPTYEIKKLIFGKERFKKAMQVTGFHHHYTLPKGVFDLKSRMLKIFRRGKIQRTMISSYNFEIAIDPALTLLSQSSPFYEGFHLAKDSRVVVYRGGKKLQYLEGVYAHHQQIGGLPPYKHTETDLLLSFKKRWQRWYREIKKFEPKIDFDKLYPYKLDITWNPIKINKLGTLEYRGLDANFLSINIAVAQLLKTCLKKIHKEFIEVLPSDFAIEEPFKFENGILYVPPHTYVRDKLQYWSSYKGYQQKEMKKYVEKFFKFASSAATTKRYKKLIKPVKEMIEKKQSMSDRILRYTKKKGWLHNNRISDAHAAKLALYYAREFPKDLAKTKKILEKVDVV